MTDFGMVPDPGTIGDRMAIAEILALHCRGVDRADLAALKSCYWPEATTAYGGEAVPAHGFCEQLVAAITHFAQTHHMVTNVLIDLDGSDARVESALIAFHYFASQDGPDTEMTYLGRYLDKFEKRDDAWKLIHRDPVMSWSQNASASHDGSNPALVALRQAARYPDDILYE